MTRDELTQAALALHVAAGALARVEPLLRRLAGRSHANDGERAAAAMYGRSAQAALDLLDLYAIQKELARRALQKVGGAPAS